MSRYEAIGTWDIEDVMPVAGCEIVTERADARDKQTGDVFSEGCFRVRLVGTPGNAPSCFSFATKRWYGETAWMDAQRYATDAFFAFQNLS